MNLRNFLTKVDRLTSQMSKSELETFVHENARLLSETKRADYLDTLKIFSQEAETHDIDVVKSQLKMSENFEQECIYFQEEILKMEEAELYLRGYYEYNEWYYDTDDELTYRDPDRVTDVITDMCEYIHRCVDYEEYAFGYEIAKRLIGLKIWVEVEEWGSCEELLTIKDLEEQQLFDKAYKQVVLDGLYLAYCANDISSRAKALYKMFEFSGMQDITLEMVMQNGEELTDVAEFLPVWIDYLGKIAAPCAEHLLKEALELMNDPEIILINARKFFDVHPVLYKQYLNSVWNTEEKKSLFAVGNEALENIDIQSVVRSKIAKRLSVLALEEQKRNDAETYWLEAFRSETTVTNYMRLFIESTDGNVYTDQTRQIYYSLLPKSGSNISSYESERKQKINNPSPMTVCMLAFLGGEFQYIRKHVMDVTFSLGWSTTFMKCGLSAFILLLLDSKELPMACKKMCSRIVWSVDFNKNEYQKWSNTENDLSSEEWFWECFKKWKEQMEVSDEQRQEYLRWIEKLIKKRVKAIMEANRRNYYDECASYIAALGEVVESWGEAGARTRILLEYKKQYSRRSAFHRELRKYGMPDTRRRRRY